jgi:exosortase family protein XrtF
VSLLKHPFFRFVGLAVVLYVGWRFAYEFYLKDHTTLDEMVIDNLVGITESLLQLFGFAITEYHDVGFRTHAGILGTNGVTVGDPCDGLVLMALFLVFVVAVPGSWKHRLWFIPTGIVAIHLINAFRVTALAMIVYYNNDWWSFNHDYTFTILVYGFVFWLWWLWVEKLNPTPSTKTTA